MTRTLIVAACLVASPALADPKKEAKQHMQAAAEAFKAGKYEDTLAELNKAYAKDPRPELHYSIGQVYVKLGRCSEAIVSYENFLASKPSAERADLANQAIAACRAQQPPAPPPPQIQPTNGVDTEAPPGMDTPPPATTATAPATTTPPPPATGPAADAPPVWYKDKLGLGLTGGGAVLTVVGLVLYSNARGKIDDAENAADYGQSQELYDDAQGQRTVSMVVVTLGLAATGIGVWRLMKQRSEDRERDVAFVPTPGGGLITYSGGF